MPGGASSLTTRGAGRWLAFAAVLIPLAVLLVLQLRTLAQLEETSAASNRLALKGYGRTILRGTEAFYRQRVEDALQVPAGLLAGDRRAALDAHFASRDGAGIKRYFVIDFATPDSEALFFAPTGGAATTASEVEARAARVAAAPWRVVAEEGTPIQSVSPSVDEQDPDNRVILRPIRDSNGHVRGAAGMILDSAYFSDVLLPSLTRAEQALVPEPLRHDLEIELGVRENGRSTTAPGADVDASFRFIFTDRSLIVRSPSETSKQWAQRRFIGDVSLSLMLAAALLAAVLLAQRNAVRATQLSQMKTDFVSSVSHELRTPLASIRVFGELLRLGRVNEPAKVREYGDYIEAECRRLTHLVNNILDFAKIESGQKLYRFERADVRALVEETLRTFEVRLRQDGFSVDVTSPPTPLPPAWVDPPAVGQVLTNLIDNAIKYSGDARHIGVALGQQNGFVTVAVRDHGPGIDAGEQERIFEQFYRVSSGLVHEVKGSGLGLAIVKHIVDAHRGRVSVDSRPGAGSTFTVELPTHAA